MTADTTAPTTPFLTVGQEVGTDAPRNSSLDRDGLRWYSWVEEGTTENRRVMSVTTARRAAGIPHRLHQWTLTQVIDRVVDNIGAIKTRLGSSDPRAVAELRAWLRLAATDERDRRAALGTAVHDAAATGRALVDVPAEVAAPLRQYLDWLDRSGAEVLLVERQVWNLTVGYAGTFDLLARFADGSLWIVDIKTGNGVYADHCLQLAAYRHAEFVGNDGVVDEAATALLRGVTGTAVLHLSPRKWEFVSLRTGPEEWRAYRGLIAFAVWTHDHPEVEDFSLGLRKGSAS